MRKIELHRELLGMGFKIIDKNIWSKNLNLFEVIVRISEDFEESLSLLIEITTNKHSLSKITIWGGDLSERLQQLMNEYLLSQIELYKEEFQIKPYIVWTHLKDDDFGPGKYYCSYKELGEVLIEAIENCCQVEVKINEDYLRHNKIS